MGEDSAKLNVQMAILATLADKPDQVAATIGRIAGREDTSWSLIICCGGRPVAAGIVGVGGLAAGVGVAVPLPATQNETRDILHGFGKKIAEECAKLTGVKRPLEMRCEADPEGTGRIPDILSREFDLAIVPHRLKTGFWASVLSSRTAYDLRLVSEARIPILFVAPTWDWKRILVLAGDEEERRQAQLISSLVAPITGARPQWWDPLAQPVTSATAERPPPGGKRTNEGKTASIAHEGIRSPETVTKCLAMSGQATAWRFPASAYHRILRKWKGTVLLWP